MHSKLSATSMAENEKQQQLHIVMFPWLAFGHMIPFLELSKLIAQKGHKISFISTPRNIDRLPKPPPPLSLLINFVKIPLPQTENLPSGAESTTDLPCRKVKYLKIAYDGLKGPITDFLRASSPDWVFFDFVPYWIPAIAADLTISTAHFYISSPASLVHCGMVGTKEYRTKPEDFTVPARWVPFETTVAFRLFEILRIFSESIEGDDENVSDVYRFKVTIKECDLLTIKSCTEFQPEWFQLTQELRQKPVLPVGFLPPAANTGVDAQWSEINEWLNKQEKGSVVYIAFGSEAQFSQEEVTEIALGLEQSGLPFFWVLRKQHSGNGTESKALPEGFEERNKRRGMVWTSWVPQLRILSHDSVGGFLNHAGWGSVVESIQFGLPLIVLTTLSDTALNARILEEKKLGYSISRDELDGSFTRDSLAESLRMVMVEEEGKIYRENAKEMSKLFINMDKQDDYINKLLAHLQSHKRTKKEKETPLLLKD